jgi:hypothetical protein
MKTLQRQGSLKARCWKIPDHNDSANPEVLGSLADHKDRRILAPLLEETTLSEGGLLIIIDKIFFTNNPYYGVKNPSLRL